MRGVLLTVFLTVMAGCGGLGAPSSNEPAAEGVKAYLDALKRDDPKSAYALLAEQVQRELSYDEFEKQWRAAQTERSFQARALGEGLKGGEDLGERASVRYEDGKAVGLERQGGEWKLETGLLSQTHAGGPREAIQLFATALAGRDYDGIMAVLTSRRKQGIGRQVDQFVESLKKNVNSEIAHIGADRAELQWDEGETRYRIVLRREGDEWRIDDVHIRKAPDEE